MAVARLSITKLILINCPTSLARSVSCPTKICPTKVCPSEPKKKAEVRQIPSTDAILPGELCARLPGDSCDEHSFGTPSGTPDLKIKITMPEDLQNTLFQMLQRLNEASLGSKNETGLAPPKGERHRTTQPDEVVIVNPVLPFSEAPVNMLNMTWVEKGKGKIIREEEEGKLAKRPTEEIGKPSEYPKAAIIKGLVMCSKCQCECELEIPPAGVLIDHELIKREARERIKQATRKNTSRSVFQRLGGDSQPKALS
ncbi:hypothetical protein ACFX2F_013137 [Malus domestica]